MPPMSRREQQRLLTRERVFNAAIEVFRRDGVTDARIEDITKAADVSRGTFYFHFPTKDHVLAALLAAEEAELVAELERFDADAPIERVLELVADSMARRWAPEPQLFVEVGVVALRDAANTLTEGPRGVRLSLAARFERAAAMGELMQAVPAQSLADLYLANAFAVAIGWCANPLAEVDLQLALRGAALLFLNGARAPG